DQDHADDRFGERLVELRGMKGDAERHSGRRVLACERYAPRQVRRLAPAASGGEAPEAADTVTDGEPRSKEVRRGKHGQSLRAHVEVREDQGRDKSAEKDAGTLQGRH